MIGLAGTVHSMADDWARREIRDTVRTPLFVIDIPFIHTIWFLRNPVQYGLADNNIQHLLARQATNGNHFSVIPEKRNSQK